MKAITLHQPYASLIAHGYKCIETRTWPTHYRGSLAIHAAKRWAPGWLRWIDPDSPDGWRLETLDNIGGDAHEDANGGGWYRPWGSSLPLGFVVATARLVDCVPIIGPDDREPAGEHVFDRGDSLWLVGPENREEIGPGVTQDLRDAVPIDDQLPFGDFTPGRWAWLLADIQRLNPPVPAKGRQGLWEWTP